MFTIRTLGKFQIKNEEHTLNEDDIRSSKLTNLLGYLLIHRNQSVTIDELAEALWLEDETENPAGALKNLMYRLRTLLKKHFGETEFILTRQGSYHFNPELEVRVDAEQFEQMLEGIKQKQMKEEEAILELNTALALYQGDFMQKNTEMHWVITLTTYYHSLYLNGVKYLCDLYVSTRRFEELETLCSRTLLKESLDEDLYCYLIRAMAEENKIGSAMEVYTKACELLERQLGISEFIKLKGIYDKLLKMKKSGKVRELAEVYQDISEENPEGVFLCGYPVFREIYRLEARKTARFDEKEYLLLVTLNAREKMSGKGCEVEWFRIRNAMQHLTETLKHSLRAGDVAAQYSDSQYVILLSTCTYEAGRSVANRIISNFYQENKIYRNLKMKINMEKVETADNILHKYTG